MKIIRLGNNKGFTLLEILIAITVFSVGLLGMATLTAVIIRGNLASEKLTTATTLAQDQVEKIIGVGYSGTPTSDTTTTEDYNSITNYSSYKRVTFTQVDNPAEGMKKITISVYWDSDAHSVVLRTILVPK